MKTYWLYYNGEVITGVRARKGLSDKEVIAEAIKQNEPTMFTIHSLEGVRPFEFENMIRHAEVRTYND